TLSPGDRKMRFVINRNVPWINTAYDFFRYNETTSEYDSVGTTNQLTFTDTGLENGQNYCYYVRSTGGYQKAGLPVNLINFSQKACAVAIDNEPPCVPDIQVTSNCEDMYNAVTWSFADPTCLDDVAGYKIYYKLKFDDSPLDTIKTINDKYQFTFNHYPGEIIAGCYGVKAFDANGNESLMSVEVCVDSCNFYEIPNVFTPNNDGKNDFLVAKTSGLVEKVDFKIFNRNGLVVFSTDRPRIEWDGTYKGNVVSPGVYFYQCDVFERRITGLEQFHISGFVHVITEEGIKVTPQQTK
ncbi:MAG TPA: gliding motility-associated C-terminal domain-containing protein, partial [Bacteroidales bacterium]|nr:gliding motility-associated C-terminal domain-containing protein [Bacteroidales bacterium]